MLPFLKPTAMKNLLLILTLIIGFTSFSQYEQELEMLKLASVTDEKDINELFSPKEFYAIPNDTLRVYESIDGVGSYVIDYSGRIVSNYVEDYSESQLKSMNSSVRVVCNKSSKFRGNNFYADGEYYYLVSSQMEDYSTITITVTKK